MFNYSPVSPVSIYSSSYNFIGFDPVPRGGVLAREFATYVRPATQAPSAANRDKSTHHRCKIYVKPTHNGQKKGSF